MNKAHLNVMPGRRTGGAAGDGYCNYCENGDLKVRASKTHSGWSCCTASACRVAGGITAPKAKEEKEKKAEPAAKPASNAPTPAQSAAPAAAKAPECREDFYDIDPGAASADHGCDSDTGAVVELLQAHEILGHRTFDPFQYGLKERGEPDRGRDDTEPADAYLVHGRYRVSRDETHAEIEDTRYVYEDELRDVLQKAEGGGDKWGELFAKYCGRLMQSYDGVCSMSDERRERKFYAAADAGFRRSDTARHQQEYYATWAAASGSPSRRGQGAPAASRSPKQPRTAAPAASASPSDKRQRR
jgi:hypothetical protein